MNWLYIVKLDWSIYQNPQRIKDYVEKGKITQQDYTTITGLSYEETV